MSTDLEPLQVTMDDAVRLTSIARRTMELMIARGEIASNKIGRRRYVPMTEIRRLTTAVARTARPPTAGPVAGHVVGVREEPEEITA